MFLSLLMGMLKCKMKETYLQLILIRVIESLVCNNPSEEYSLTSFFALAIEIQNNLFNHFFYSRGNLESGSFSYLGNSVCKYIRNSAKFRGIP